MIFSESNANISAALTKAWSQIDTPRSNAKVEIRTKKSGSYTFEYTDLNGILDAIRPVFQMNGISVHQNSYTLIENGIAYACVETMFLHESGEYIKSFPLKFPIGQEIKELGGQITYMKRYSLASMLGVAIDKDGGNESGSNQYGYYKKQQSQQSYHQQNPKQQTTAQRQSQQPYSLITNEQVAQLEYAINVASKQTKMSTNDVLNYAKLNLRIPPEMPLNQLSQEQAKSLYHFLLNIKGVNNKSS